MLLSEIARKTENLFASELLRPESAPKLTVLQKDKLAAFDVAQLSRQKASLLFEIREQHAAEMGFQRLELEDVAQMLMGARPHTTGSRWLSTNYYEWFYNHIQEKTKSGCSYSEVLMTRFKHFNWIYDFANFFFPSISSVKWQVKANTLDMLKKEIPYGVLLRIEEIKKLNFFNAFVAVAPAEAWRQSPEPIDPVILAINKEFPEESTSSGRISYYFVAKW